MARSARPGRENHAKDSGGGGGGGHRCGVDRDRHRRDFPVVWEMVGSTEVSSESRGPASATDPTESTSIADLSQVAPPESLAPPPVDSASRRSMSGSGPIGSCEEPGVSTRFVSSRPGLSAEPNWSNLKRPKLTPRRERRRTPRIRRPGPSRPRLVRMRPWRRTCPRNTPRRPSAFRATHGGPPRCRRR